MFIGNLERNLFGDFGKCNGPKFIRADDVVDVYDCPIDINDEAIFFAKAPEASPKVLHFPGWEYRPLTVFCWLRVVQVTAFGNFTNGVVRVENCEVETCGL